VPAKSSLLIYTANGLYCPEADIYIDPARRVESAIITHAHSDHAKKGHKNYIAHPLSVPVMKHRITGSINVTALEYGKVININGVKISLHPAGHIPGSSQVRVERKGEVWVVSGDYKIENDDLTEPFELIKCHTFITESTFALPAYKWKVQKEIFNDINLWWKNNIERGKISVLTGYSLGKAQRLFKNVDHSIGKIYGHEGITTINNLFIEAGLSLPPLETISDEISPNELSGSLIIAPPSVIGSEWLSRFEPFSVGYASGWMIFGKRKRSRGIDAGFVLSDHADWDGLNYAVKETGAENIFVTHGYSSVFVRWLRKIGYNAHELKSLGSEKFEYNTSETQLKLF
jgi:putative mRNA 3-end processing factor